MGSMKATVLKLGGVGLGVATLLGVAATASTALAGQPPALLEGLAAQRPAPAVQREAAIARATADSKVGNFDVQSQEARVDAAKADLISLEEADRRLNGQRGSGTPGVDGNTQVWWVTVTGSFRGQSHNGPNGRGPSVQGTERVFVYDANSGRLLAMRVPAQ
jgi:hypothetical protein